VTLPERLWGAALEVARPLLPALGLGSRKRARAVAERRGAVQRLEAWAARERAPDRPLVWLHGASAGELSGAVPVVDALRERRELQLAVTYFSPSGEGAAAALGPDVTEALPLDAPRDVGRALDVLRPAALVFSKGDLWPNLTRAARRRGVPMGLVNAALEPGSSRLRWPARPLLAPAYGRLDAVAAVSEADARRLRRLGVREGALRVAGDAAFDRAEERARAAAAGGSAEGGSAAARLRSLRPAGCPVLVAGSTWPPDEEALLAALAALASAGIRWWPVLVPHEPEPGAVERIARRCRELVGSAPLLWSEVDGCSPREGTEAGADRVRTAAGTIARPEAVGPVTPKGERLPPPLLVDRVGILAELYPSADAAWVGGGYGRGGLHSVVEPAAAGVPILFGTEGRRREARALRERGAARRLAPDEVPGALRELAGDPERRARMGAAARGYVEENLGAGARAAALVGELLAPGGGDPGEDAESGRKPAQDPGP